MDITLERILSLLPKKENGKFKHGALAEFARKLGFKDGHIISDWIAGNSTSYSNYLYQISSLYHVSVEWLKGETDIEKPLGPEAEGLTDIQNEAMEFMRSLTDDQLRRFIAMGRAAFEKEP